MTRWVSATRINREWEQVMERLQDENEEDHEPTRPEAAPKVVEPISYETLLTTNGQLYSQLQEQETEIAELRKVTRQLEQLRSRAFHRGVVEGIKRCQDEAAVEFGVASLRIEQMLSEVDR